MIKPEKQAALFAKEFQDMFFKTVFTKDNDDDDPVNATTTTAPHTTMAALATTANCSNNAQVFY